MNVKIVKIFDYEIRIEDKDLVDPTYFEIRAILKRPFW